MVQAVSQSQKMADPGPVLGQRKLPRLAQHILITHTRVHAPLHVTDIGTIVRRNHIDDLDQGHTLQKSTRSHPRIAKAAPRAHRRVIKSISPRGQDLDCQKNAPDPRPPHRHRHPIHDEEAVVKVENITEVIVDRRTEFDLNYNV